MDHRNDKGQIQMTTLSLAEIVNRDVKLLSDNPEGEWTVTTDYIDGTEPKVLRCRGEDLADTYFRARVNLIALDKLCKPRYMKDVTMRFRGEVVKVAT